MNYVKNYDKLEIKNALRIFAKRLVLCMKLEHCWNKEVN